MDFRRSAALASGRVFRAAERGGFHLMPIHYYTPVANRKQLRVTEESWRRPAPMTGVQWDANRQSEWLFATAAGYSAELPIDQLRTESELVGGFRYGPIEAQMLHAFVRRYAPPRIIEIGSGSTTMIMSQASDKNMHEGRGQTAIRAIDPFANPAVASLPSVELSATGALELRPEDLGLQSGDLLFIDSTHAVHTGSEVPHLYLNVIPSLPPGVTIHIHDIFLPYLFPPDVYKTYFDWQETVLLAGLLVNNPSLEILVAMSYLHTERPEALKKVFPDYKPRSVHRGLYVDDTDDTHFPTSLWIRTA